MEADKVYLQWMDKLEGHEELLHELEEIRGNAEEIEDRFCKELEFGTAGLRGKLGAGTNRMNEFTVGKATQGIAEFISEKGEEYRQRGVVIAYDCRHFSKEFAVLASEILAANGVHVFIFESLRPTPELSYTIRRLKAAAGINITASHNPKQYNGYKVYWESGAQVLDNIADGMYEKIQQVDMFEGVARSDFDRAVGKGIVTVLPEKTDRDYMDLVKSLAIRGGAELEKALPIVYTPLNGAGSIPVKTILSERGFTGIHVVPEQEFPDPDFTTVGYPNPEDTKAFALSEKLGADVGAEVLIATDPDADRMAVEVRDESGNYVSLNGNQTGVILIHYILEGLEAVGKLPEKGAMIKSIVTGDMGAAIGKAYGVEMFETLTGFKNICGKIPEIKKNGYQYVFGYEESIGYAVSEEVRDKDGISAAMFVCEAAAFYRKQGKTLLQVLQELYEKYGYYKEEQVSIVLEGIAGAKRIGRMLEAFRTAPLAEFGGMKVEEVIDYQNGYKDISKSNVLKFVLENETWFSVRPSGTEPKVKLYFYTKGESEGTALAAIERVKEDVLKQLNHVQ
ncbi:phospho-sugar mutase [Muricomes intestini]|uniref:Phosphoglucomutase n=1 Tax=Muricomes intestini TaxID=1796634 RepID=A0A4R3KF08_9FIRM|nr:phospho-sugar mutase [Muricomes intestini]TCS81695.1 phosphoglucomutase [Muricomes intestini]HCR82713.1 phosphoglucomutase [Lachnospiraceae bacterium]